MELEMQWDGNPNIVLDIRTRVGVGLPVQVTSDFCPLSKVTTDIVLCVNVCEDSLCFCLQHQM